MRNHPLRSSLASAILALALLACTLLGQTAAPPPPVAVVTAMDTLAMTPSPQSVPGEASVTPTLTPSSTPTITGPLVTQAVLCYVGPALKGYDVTSAIKAGTAVELLGRSPLDGWWVIRDPRYHDPCWIQSDYLQIDPAMNTSGLPVYNVPGTNTPGPSPTPA